MKMKIEISHKKILCLFIFIICALLWFGAFYNRQIAHATTDKTTQVDSDDQYDSADQEEMKTDKKDEKKDSSFNFKKKMSFKVLKEAVANNEIDSADQVPVSIHIGDSKPNREKDPRTNMDKGIINENTLINKLKGEGKKTKISEAVKDARFVGAYVVFADGEETQIYYTGCYSETVNNKTEPHTYYAYSPTPETGVLLEEPAYIVLKYEASYDISYRVETKDQYLANNPTKYLSNGLGDGDEGGHFVTPTQKLTRGTDLNIHFIPSKISDTEGSYHLRKLYKSPTKELTKKTPISFDSDNAAKTEITEDTTIVAVVDNDDLYRMHVVNPFAEHHGYICWKGYSGWIYDSKTGTFKGNYTDGPTDEEKFPIYALPQICDPDDPNAVTVVKDDNGTKHGVRYANVKKNANSSYDTSDIDKGGFQDVLYTN